ncbi:hypothetical protein PsorP6_017946 [Peronosclerospora sorghi]|uniref:Uncharacterized protein n=1 Tax=Peronosclerospora sorghi TaxID=230839 RepID=A0ACC0WF86_9STRA|nr:hypothetical protein PsorP6_017946 [Peronosclerospora sorghi]
MLSGLSITTAYISISEFQTAADRFKELISFVNEELTSGNFPNGQHVMDHQQLHFSASCY